MRKIYNLILAILSLLSFNISNAQSNKGFNTFIPKGFKIIDEVEGDLNKDGIPDKAIVIEATNPENFIKNESLGMDTINTNPRRLLILFGDKSKNYRLVAKNDISLIPSAGEEESPCLADPFLQDGGLTINNGVLILDLNYWLSCGSYGVSHETFTFRFQNNQMQLIGLDYSEYSRASGEMSKTSINLSTKKKSITKGGNMFDEKSDKPKTVWSTIKTKQTFRLESVNSTTFYDVIEWK